MNVLKKSVVSLFLILAIGNAAGAEFDNVPVATAIAALADDPSPANRVRLYRALKGGWLFLAARSVPPEWTKGPVTLAQAATISVLTSTSPNQGKALLAFTSRAAVSRRNKDAGSFAMASREVLQLMIRDGYSALVIDPGGPWAGVPKEDVEKILQDSR